MKHHFEKPSPFPMVMKLHVQTLGLFTELNVILGRAVILKTQVEHSGRKSFQAFQKCASSPPWSSTSASASVRRGTKMMMLRWRSGRGRTVELSSWPWLRHFLSVSVEYIFRDMDIEESGPELSTPILAC